MRPSIDISHELGGRVKDFAERHGLELDEAYGAIIEVGLNELEKADEDEIGELFKR